jgi:GAF domain-containing protein
VSKEKDKPVFDELTFAKLLEAAYVLQEHNRELQAMGRRAGSPDSPARQEQPVGGTVTDKHEVSDAALAAKHDYTLTLAQIVETQHQIQVRHLEADKVMALVAERVTELTKASGAAIGILDGNKVRYKATAGGMALPAGSEIPLEKALCKACLRSGEVIRCGNITPELQLDAEECRHRRIQSLIAVPVYHEGGVAGGLELYYAAKHAFTEQDVHTCQLMAGLVTEALAESDEAARKKSLASERAVILEALEKLKPDLAALAEASAAKDSGSKPTAGATAKSAPTFLCRKCGHELVGEEQFCGRCGSPRGSSYEPPTMQSKVASLWHMQEALRKSASPVPADGAPPPQQWQAGFDEKQPEKALADAAEKDRPGLFAAPELRIEEAAPSAKPPESAVDAEIEEDRELLLAVLQKESQEDEGSSSAETKLAEAEPVADWSSAASAHAFLERLVAQRPGAWARFWSARRGDFYLVIAVILVACAIRWGIWSSHRVSATGRPAAAAAVHRRPAPEADLSLFDRMLVKLGLAEAPEPPEYKGNPTTRVWVDLQTALYYCPGNDLYGKTPKGKFTTQRDAQLDQFEPAYRKACD